MMSDAGPSNESRTRKRPRQTAIYNDGDDNYYSSESDSDYEPLTDDSDSSASLTDGELSSETSEDSVPEEEVISWNNVTGSSQSTFPATFASGLKVPCLPYHQFTPVKCFSFFIDDEVISLMVRETNSNASRFIATERISRQSRVNNWKDTTDTEMRQFLGLLLWMGLDRRPNIADYWSTDVLYKNELTKNSKIMRRNRFELILRFWHFADDTNQDNDRLYKLRPLLNLIISSFKKMCEPGLLLAVDETMIPFRGRLKFRQYIQGKRHKYGVKVFKVCDPDGYTYDLQIYQGKSLQPRNSENSLSCNIVLELCRDYLFAGRTIITDNFYTSVELAHKLIAQNTHLVGTLRKNRRNIPDSVKKGQVEEE